MKYVVTLAFLLLTIGCAPSPDVIRINDGYIEFNGAQIESLPELIALVEGLPKNSSVLLMPHACLNAVTLIEVLGTVKAQGFKKIELTGYGALNDNDCE